MKFLPTLPAAAAVLASCFSIQSTAQSAVNSALSYDEVSESKTAEAVWPQDSCDKLQEAAGSYIYLSGQAVKKAHESTDPAVKEKSFGAGVALSQLSANAASVYEVFCSD
ncbi:MAG: hypothetical protein CME57_07510 [Halieaceae bacterium]|nr:hypothetical protein [Halieaceae bacterium]